MKTPAGTCANSATTTPVNDGEWHCARHDMKILLSVQKNGCDSHLYNPYLLEQFAEPVDSGEYWIRYRLKSTGEEFVTGDQSGQWSSKEINKVNDKNLMTEEKLAQLTKSAEFSIHSAKRLGGDGSGRAGSGMDSTRGIQYAQPR